MSNPLPTYLDVNAHMGAPLGASVIDSTFEEQKKIEEEERKAFMRSVERAARVSAREGKSDIFNEKTRGPSQNSEGGIIEDAEERRLKKWRKLKGFREIYPDFVKKEKGKCTRNSPEYKIDDELEDIEFKRNLFNGPEMFHLAGTKIAGGYEYFCSNVANPFNHHVRGFEKFYESSFATMLPIYQELCIEYPELLFKMPLWLRVCYAFYGLADAFSKAVDRRILYEQSLLTPPVTPSPKADIEVPVSEVLLKKEKPTDRIKKKFAERVAARSSTEENKTVISSPKESPLVKFSEEYSDL